MGEGEAPCRGGRRFPWSLREVLASEEIWMCASCYTCVDRCPRDVDFTYVSLALRNLAAREGFIPDALRMMGNTILQTGLVYKMPASRLKAREKHGLPPLPSTDVKQVRELLEAVGFPALLAKKAEG